MLPGTPPLESITGSNGTLDRIHAVYVSGAGQPGWDNLSVMARHGVPVSVFARGGEAQQFRQRAGTVPVAGVYEIPEDLSHFGDIVRTFPAGYNLLVLDEPTLQFEMIRDALAVAAPEWIVMNEVVEDGATRRAKYAVLTGMNYRFGGMDGWHARWTRTSEAPKNRNLFLSELPLEIAGLELRGTGEVKLDNESVPPDGIWNLAGRAELSIFGWAVIDRDQPPAKEVFAVVTHDQTGRTEYMQLAREPRTDVAQHFQSERLVMTGFRADLSGMCRSMGTHSVSILQSDGKGRYQSKVLFRFALRLQDYELTVREGLAKRYLFGSGIEIGALQKPLRVSPECKVRYIDRMPIESLIEHYPEMAKFPLQAPDIIDDGQQLTHIAEDSQDFVIANHFLEHCPDPIRSLGNILRVVKYRGVVFMAVPDKRHTFDLLRPETPYAALRSAYLSGERAGKEKLFHEWAKFVLRLGPEDAREKAEELLAEDYSIHYNVWTTEGLLRFLLAAQWDFQMPFELLAAVSTENETIVVLERGREK